VRQWLIENGFRGNAGQTVPEMTDEYVNQVSDRYIELYENIIGEKFQKANPDDTCTLYQSIECRIPRTSYAVQVEKNVTEYLAQLK